MYDFDSIQSNVGGVKVEIFDYQFNDATLEVLSSEVSKLEQQKDGAPVITLKLGACINPDLVSFYALIFLTNGHV